LIKNARMKLFRLIAGLMVTLLLAGPVMGQKKRDLIAQADKTYAIGEYFNAIEKYKKAFSREKDRTKRLAIKLKIGNCYRLINDTRKAESYYSLVVKQKLADLIKAKNDKSLPLDEREQAEEEYLSLLKAYDRGGKVSGQAEQAVDRVRKAIRNLINELKDAKRQQGLVNVALAAFGEHLEQNLWLPSMGGKNRAGASGKPGCFIYEPPAGVRWKD